MINLERLDHLVLTVADMRCTCDFYHSFLGCQVIHFESSDGTARVALKIGDHAQKINLHSAEQQPFLPAAKVPYPGSADLCFITSTPCMFNSVAVDRLPSVHNGDIVVRSRARLTATIQLSENSKNRQVLLSETVSRKEECR